MDFFHPDSDPAETPNTLICFTDGSTIDNGSKDAKGGFAVVWPFHSDHNFKQHLFPSTNNRAEYSAIIHALRQADVLDDTKTKTLIIYTDSMLIINSMTKWLPNWKKNNYMKSDGKPVLNKDLIQQVETLMQTRKVVFRHVRAHTNKKTWEAVNNNLADKMAKDATFQR
jgi:ribonuclease HI